MLPQETTVRERFLVELAPGSGGCDPGSLTQRVRSATRARDGIAPIRLVRTIYVPEDGSSYLLVEAGSVDEIEHALREVGLETRSVDAAIQVGATRT